MLAPLQFPQRSRGGGFQRRHITLNHAPEAHYINAVVFMPKPVSQAANIPPINLGAEFRSQLPKFCRRFADDEQRVLHGEEFLLVFDETLKV